MRDVPAVTKAGPILKACACLADARGRLLVFRHPGDGDFQLPKGGIEPGEAPEAAARRELLEESGIRFDGPLEPLGTLEREHENGRQRWHVFLMRSTAEFPDRFEHVAFGSPEEDGLIFDYRWLAPDAPLAPFAEAYREAISRARAALRAAPGKTG